MSKINKTLKYIPIYFWLIVFTVVPLLMVFFYAVFDVNSNGNISFTLDFLKGTLFKDMKDKTQLLIMRLLIVFFIVISVVIALDPPTFIAQLMGISWGALAGAFLAPFLYGLYWKGVTKAAVWASFIAGVGVTLSNMFIGYIESPINAGAIAMIAGLIVVPIVSLITPKLKKEMVDKTFECYDEKVEVTGKTSLKEK